MTVLCFHINYIIAGLLETQLKPIIICHTFITMPLITLTTHILYQMKGTVLGLCLTLFILIELGLTQAYPEFASYVIQYNKTYESSQQYQQRKAIYESNLLKLDSIARQMQCETGVNKFTDRTQTELNSMRNQRIRPLSRSVTPHYSIKRKLGGPSSLDWRAKGAVSPVKDQGWCGSCWAFSTAAFCESSLIINNGYKNDIDLSEQYLLECTQQSDCKGGFPAYALLTVVNRGIPKQETFPYNPAVQHNQICESRKNLKIKGDQVYVYFSLSDLEIIYLLQISPIIVGVASADWQFYKGGVMKCRPNVTEDHAVLLVGYTPEYWIVKNQWGENWGEKGFIRISRHPEHNCLMGVEVDTLNDTRFPTALALITFLIALLIN